MNTGLFDPLAPHDVTRNFLIFAQNYRVNLGTWTEIFYYCCTMSGYEHMLSQRDYFMKSCYDIYQSHCVICGGDGHTHKDCGTKRRFKKHFAKNKQMKSLHSDVMSTMLKNYFLVPQWNVTKSTSSSKCQIQPNPAGTANPKISYVLICSYKIKH